MPLNSAEIAAASGQFQQMYAGQTQYSSMIGGMSGMQGAPGVQADQIAGGLMNRAHAIGAPVASLGVGLLGLDPMSIGLKAGMGAFSSGSGFMGAGVAGLGAAAGVGVPMAMAGYAANQMWAGAQQQQSFNQGMRNSFNFQTPYGQGFSNGQLGQINQQMYSMSNQSGPGGEMMGVRELSQIAQNMGRMGQTSGVQDVSQFSSKFREMVNTLKVVAKEMGTSLQAAQEFVVAMKGSGIFNSGQQRQLAGEIKQFAQSGNLATSELTAAASIGAQVSRSIGGRGSAGAFAGIRTLGNIGSAVQAGVISEEDIYNATGLTGAEGRQALATRQLEQSGNFLRTGRGRMFLASVAGQNGQLDPDSVQDWLSGGMGVGDTRGHAKRNLGRLGKAGFLRNEGRLRGKALEQFGGMLPTMALMQWASSKGIDVNEMDDRSMMFASRQLGMGQDELEDSVKMARSMPRIMEQQRSSNEMGQFQSHMAEIRRTTGIEGMQRKLERARDTVQGSLQREGAKFFTDISEMVESYINKMTGVVTEEYDKEVADAFHSAMSGGGMSRLNRVMGGGGGKGGLRMGGGMGTDGMTPGSGSDRFFGRQSAGQKAAGALQYLSLPGMAMKYLMSSDTGFEKMQKAGYGGLFTGSENDEALQRQMGRIQGLQTAAMTAGKGDVLASSLHAEFRNLYTGKMRDANGADRVEVLRDFLTKKAAAGNKDAAAELDKLNKGGLEAGMKMLSATESATKIGEGSRTLDNMAAPSFSITSQGYATMGDRNRAFGAAILGKSDLERFSLKHEQEIGTANKVIKGANAFATMGLSLVTDYIGDKIGNAIVGDKGKSNPSAHDVGEYINSTEGKALISSLAAGDAGAHDKIQDLLMDRNLPAGKEAALRSMLAASKATDLRNKLGREPTPAEWADLNRQVNDGNKGPQVDAQGAEQVVGGVAQGLAQAAKRQVVRDLLKTSGENVRSMLISGVAHKNEYRGGRMELNVDAFNAMSKGLSREGSDKLRMGLKEQMMASERGTRVTEGSSAEELSDIIGHYGWGTQMIGSMSSSDLLRAARQGEAGGDITTSSMLRQLGASNAQIERRLKRGGGANAVAGALGLNLTKGQMKGLQGLSGDKASEQLLNMAGIGSDSSISAETRAHIGEMIKNRDINGLRSLGSGTSKEGKEVQEALDKKRKTESLDQDKAKNPLMAKVEEHLSKLRDLYEGDIGAAIKQTAAATKISASSDQKQGDTEKGSTGSDQPGKS